MLLSALTLLGAVLADSSANAQNKPAALPDIASTKSNAFHIFNAIHSAGRQWGSSVNDNGFGMIPSTIPAGTMLYHGTRAKTIPTTAEWLAFEVEHADNFARRWQRIGEKESNRLESPLSGFSPVEQNPLRAPAASSTRTYRKTTHEPNGAVKGYLHTYQTQRDLKLLLLDGMSAADGPNGSDDLWQMLVSEHKDSHTPGDDDGAVPGLGELTELCKTLAKLKYDGLIRMEMGFEVIYCNFDDGGLEQTSVVSRLAYDEELLPEDETRHFRWARAASQRYDGIGGDRFRIEFSSMVSGLFFPFNFSSSGGVSQRIRLGAAGDKNLKALWSYSQDVLRESASVSINWQGIVDMVVTRFSARLAMLSLADLSADLFRREIDGLALTYLSVESISSDEGEEASEVNRTEEAIARCKDSYLRPALISKREWTLTDKLLFTATEVVVNRICTDFMLIRDSLAQSRGKQGQDIAVSHARITIRELTEKLAWAEWRRKQACAADAVLFIAMFPVGNVEDHRHPECLGADQFDTFRKGYWDE